MKVVGLITEYNPFHNGHKYHIEEAKRITGADYCVAVMSGNFVQRGIPAMIDKYERTEMALRNGVDLIIELPVCYATSSAELFAHGAISILDKLGIIDAICFGSECGDIGLLREGAQFLLNPPTTYEKYLQSYLKQGLTYPAARSKALRYYLKEQHSPYADTLSQVLAEPNNILGIEYMKALLRLNSNITPMTIQRISAHYHEEQLGVISESLPADSRIPHVISSATAIRKAVQGVSELNNHLNNMQFSVPEDVFNKLKTAYQKLYPTCEDDFLSHIQYKLLSETNQSLVIYSDITKDLADRLNNRSNYYSSFSELANDIKTKNMTLTRINRALIHILLNLKNEALNEYNANGYAQYARVLGMKKSGSHLLRKIEKQNHIPIITKVSKAQSILSPLAFQMLQEDLFAAHLYNQIVYAKYSEEILNEYRHGIVII